MDIFTWRASAGESTTVSYATGGRAGDYDDDVPRDGVALRRRHAYRPRQSWPRIARDRHVIRRAYSRDNAQTRRKREITIRKSHVQPRPSFVSLPSLSSSTSPRLAGGEGTRAQRCAAGTRRSLGRGTLGNTRARAINKSNGAGAEIPENWTSSFLGC